MAKGIPRILATFLGNVFRISAYACDPWFPKEEENSKASVINNFIASKLRTKFIYMC